MGQRVAVLAIAGTDSSGGAGLLRDVQTLEAMGAQALCAVTAVTAQTDSRVLAVHVIPPDQVRLQIEAAFATQRVRAVKIGMLGDRATIDAVADALAEAPRVPVVLDPVLRASSGGVLLDDPGYERLRSRLMPQVSLLTPNIPEAAWLNGATPGEDATVNQRIEWAQALLAGGARAVLLKGGHAQGRDATDVLVRPGLEPQWLSSPRLSARSRGTGCALAAAIAAALATGAEMFEACRRGREHVLALLAKAETR